MDDEAIWRRRFAVFMAVRLFALVLVLAGMGIWLGDYVRPGGWPLLGGDLGGDRADRRADRCRAC